jgi:hypothetical protein
MALNKEELRNEIKKFISLLREQQNEYDSQKNIKYSYPCGEVIHRLSTFWVLLGKE